MSQRAARPATSRTQRARRACEPCRKRKAKCSGEQPTCSLCERLNHQCSYRPRYGQFREYRVRNDPQHEAEHSWVPVADDARPVPAVQSALRTAPGPSQSAVDLEEYTLPPFEVLESVWETYFTYVNLQPVPLLVPMSLRRNLVGFPLELIHGVLAVAIRHSAHPFFGDMHAEFSDRHRRLARSMVFKALEESGNIGLSTIQAICLICLADYLDGFGGRATLTLGIGIRLAYSLNLLKSGNLENMSEKEEVVRCCWSLVALERLFSIASGNGAPLIDENDLPRYPTSQTSPSRVPPSPEACVPSPEAPLDLGIVAYCLQLTPTWGKVLQYAIKNKNSKTPELHWMADSEYNRINARILHFEAVCPDEHRWWKLDFLGRTGEELERNRGYWAPWLCQQSLFHACLALLNHPLIFMRAPPAYSIVPLSFTKSTSGQAQLHTNWIAYFADLVEKKGITVTNPFVAFSMAIATTIQLFHSRAEDQGVADRARRNFGLCRGMVRKMGNSMPIVAELSRKLEMLNLDGAAPIKPNLVWSIIEYIGTSLDPDGDIRFDNGGTTADCGESPNAVVFQHEDTPSTTVEQNLNLDAFVPVDFGQYSFPVFDPSVLDDMTFGNL